MLMMGCEAPLQLDDVLIEQQKATHRSDRLQKITTNGDVNVVDRIFWCNTNIDERGGLATTKKLLHNHPFI